MSKGAAQDQGLNKVVDQLCAMEGVECENLADGRIALQIFHNGASTAVSVAVSASEYRLQKDQYSDLRDALTEAGIEEGQTFVAAKLPRRPMTPQMRAARQQKKNAHDAWQEMWRTIRRAEKALDVEYEIAQMRDYY